MIKRPLLIISCLCQIIFCSFEMIFRVFQINFHDLEIYLGGFAGIAAARFRTCQTAPRIIQNTLPLCYISNSRTARFQVNVIPKRLVGVGTLTLHHHRLVAISK